MTKRHRNLWFAVVLLLLAAGLRLWALGTLPPGFSDIELDNLSVTEIVNGGYIRVFEQTAGHRQETLYHILQALFT